MNFLAVPPPSGPILVPTDDSRSFTAGLTLWSATRRSARIARRSLWLAGRIVPPRWLPGQRTEWTAPFSADVLGAHQNEWRSWFGSYDVAAVYQPAQVERSGFAFLLLRGGRPVGFVKSRPGWDPGSEIDTVARVTGADTFVVPAVVGVAEDGGWTSVGTQPLPAGLHGPNISVPVAVISEEVSTRLGPASGAPPGWRAIHGDMGPWNLRQPPTGRPVLFDWEETMAGPEGADLVFHTAASRALGVRSNADIGPYTEAREFWREVIPERFGKSRRDARLAGDMMDVLGFD